MEQLVKSVKEFIKKVRLGQVSTWYINYQGFVIRISNHGANPARCDEKTLSLIVNDCVVDAVDKDDDSIIYSFSERRKKFKNIINQYNIEEVYNIDELVREFIEC